MGIIRYSGVPSDRSDSGVDAHRMVTSAMGAKTITSGVSTFEPGASILLHTHPCEETVVVVEGEAICELNGERFTMKPYDASFVPPEVPHRFINESDKPLTIIYFYPDIDVSRDPFPPNQ